MKIVIDIGSPVYWSTKSIELVREAQAEVPGCPAYHELMKEAITLLALARTYYATEGDKGERA